MTFFGQGKVPDVPNGNGDWTGWIISLAVLAVGGLVGTVKFLATKIEGYIVNELKESQDRLKESSERHDRQLTKLEDTCSTLTARAEECEKERGELRVRIGQLETERRFINPGSNNEEA